MKGIEMTGLKQEITSIAREMGIDKVGFTSRERLRDAPPSGDLPYILPTAKSAISLTVALDKAAIRAYLAKENQMRHVNDHNMSYITLGISAGKLFPSRVFWNSKKYGGVEPDIDRVRKFVAERVANHGFFILIDEGSHFTKMPLPEGGTWMDWGPSPYSKARISLLRVKFPS